MAITTTSHRDLVLAHGREMFFRIALELRDGQHLISCVMEMAPGVRVPARALVEVTEEVIGFDLDNAQVDTFATVLGAGLLNTAVEVCEVTVRSSSLYGFPTEQVWEKDMGTGLRALTAGEAQARRAFEANRGTDFRDAFPLDLPSGIVTA
ncbi:MULTISPECIES: hypothetical protein [unclassified Streptomyces]|uniref:hypothetical protein n=1 Tax=unclassified Streptomyces TaxID=2593676 RepID=UPI002E29A298|nr:MULTISPECIES: hypothetical protein [unclassified Streptomyces]